MEDYIRARSGCVLHRPGRGLRSNRAFCQAAGHYACDMFIGSTLQIDLAGQQLDRDAGSDLRLRRRAQHGRRRAGSPACQPRLAQGRPRGRAPAAAACRAAASSWCRWSRPSASTWQPAFVEKLDAWELAEQRRHGPAAGDDLRRRRHATSSPRKGSPTCCSAAPTEEREQAIRGVAGYTPVGLGRDKRMVENLRDRGVIRRAEDLGVDKRAGHARPACGAVDQGSRAGLGRALRPAQALPQLVREDHNGNVGIRIQGRAHCLDPEQAGSVRRRWVPAISKSWSSRPTSAAPARSWSRRPPSASARPGARSWTMSSPAGRWPTCASRSTTPARRPRSYLCGSTRR